MEANKQLNYSLSSTRRHVQKLLDCHPATSVHRLYIICLSICFFFPIFFSCFFVHSMRSPLAGRYIESFVYIIKILLCVFLIKKKNGKKRKKKKVCSNGLTSNWMAFCFRPNFVCQIICIGFFDPMTNFFIFVFFVPCKSISTEIWCNRYKNLFDHYHWHLVFWIFRWILSPTPISKYVKHLSVHSTRPSFSLRPSSRFHLEAPNEGGREKKQTPTQTYLRH